jgi:hypothetical protein
LGTQSREMLSPALFSPTRGATGFVFSLGDELDPACLTIPPLLVERSGHGRLGKARLHRLSVQTFTLSRSENRASNARPGFLQPVVKHPCTPVEFGKRARNAFIELPDGAGS